MSNYCIDDVIVASLVLQYKCKHNHTTEKLIYWWISQKNGNSLKNYVYKKKKTHSNMKQCVCRICAALRIKIDVLFNFRDSWIYSRVSIRWCWRFNIGELAIATICRTQKKLARFFAWFLHFINNGCVCVFFFNSIRHLFDLIEVIIFSLIGEWSLFVSGKKYRPHTFIWIVWCIVERDK